MGGAPEIGDAHLTITITAPWTEDRVQSARRMLPGAVRHERLSDYLLVDDDHACGVRQSLWLHDGERLYQTHDTAAAVSAPDPGAPAVTAL